MIDLILGQVSEEAFAQLPTRLRYNNIISNYYENYYEEEKNNCDDKRVLLNKAKRLTECSQIWTSNYYRWHNAKEVLSMNLCRDRFCYNCQSALAYARYLKFGPILSQLSVNHSLYHCVFTVKNCSGTLLRFVIKQMFNSYASFVRILDGRRKLRDYDFSEFGYKGSVRALEVTFNKENNEYHPHLHCIFVFSKSFHLEKVFKNAFSYSNQSNEITMFSAEEIFFPKNMVFVK